MRSIVLNFVDFLEFFDLLTTQNLQNGKDFDQIAASFASLAFDFAFLFNKIVNSFEFFENLSTAL